MLLLAAIPAPAVRLVVFLVGLALGAVANWAIYCLAWNPRPISPWGPTPADSLPRTRRDRLPVVGWLSLRREHHLHGRWFWVRPLLIELGMGIGLVCLWWWEVEQRALVVPQLDEQLRFAGLGPVALLKSAVPLAAVWPTFLSHSMLLTFMVAASFIDIDEKIIPDEITVPGTLLGLVLVTCLPVCLLPWGTFADRPPELAVEIALPQVGPGVTASVAPVIAATPNAWPESLAPASQWRSLVVGQACWWLWCVALAPRIWRGRHGPWRAITLICRRVTRELTRPPLGFIAWVGAALVLAVWWLGGTAWLGLLSSLIGLAASGMVVWVVRVVASHALGREAMGFGDVTLMMMIGAFLGWQACVVVFFVAPFAGLVVGIVQAVTKRDDVIPYGPFLCLGTLGVIVGWSSVWNHVEFAFQFGWLVPAVLAVCFALLGILLVIWKQIKNLLFGPYDKNGGEAT
jgi:prepilin signal peptidase PulO-like enzyme (type II secretory pathway)